MSDRFRRGRTARKRGDMNPGCPGRATSAHGTIEPVRVDITMWLDSERTDIHVHEDARGDGPMIPFDSLPPESRLGIAERLARWTHELARDEAGLRWSEETK